MNTVTDHSEQSTNPSNQWINLLKKIEDNFDEPLSNELCYHYSTILKNVADREYCELIDDFLWDIENIVLHQKEYSTSPDSPVSCDACGKALCSSWYHCRLCNDNYDECKECYDLKLKLHKPHPHISYMRLIEWGFFPAIDDNSSNILTFDGGGICGYSSVMMFEHYCSNILSKLETSPVDSDITYLTSLNDSYKQTGTTISFLDFFIQDLLLHKFHLICGTSIGGIVALLLSLRIPFSTVKGLFENHADTVFMKEPFFKVSHSKYTSKGLQQVFRDIITSHLQKDPMELTMKDVALPCAVTSFNMYSNDICLFSNTIDKHRDLKVIDAMLATSAAPTYFPVHKFNFNGKPYECVDGGLWAHDPRLFALFVERMINAHNRHKTYNVLSFGTGKVENPPPHHTLFEGESTLGWLTRTPNIIDVIFAATRSMSEKFHSFIPLTGLVRCVKIDAVFEKYIDLDDKTSLNLQKGQLEKLLETPRSLINSNYEMALRLTWMMGRRNIGEKITLNLK